VMSSIETEVAKKCPKCGISGMRKIADTNYYVCDYCGCRDKRSMSDEEIERLKIEFVNTPQRRAIYNILEEWGELSNPQLKRIADSEGVTCGDEVARQMRPLTVTWKPKGQRCKWWKLAWR